MASDTRNKQAVKVARRRERTGDIDRKGAAAARRARLTAAADDGATGKELAYMRKCKRAGKIPRLGSSGVGGGWGL